MKYVLKEEKSVKLKDYDASDTELCSDKEKAEEHLGKLRAELGSMQELLAANAKQKVLIVLQGMDTAGKDGTISSVFTGINPQGVRVWSFKKPTPIETAHDFLWRVHMRVPENGEIVIFNRSHYEDVLFPKVHKTISEETVQRRYKDINNFERMLVYEGTTILKFYLHIDRDEQTRRLRERLETKDKQWKLSAADLAEREFWNDYQRAYEGILEKTSTERAPWHIVPANHKWYRNIFVTHFIVEAMKSLDLKAPKPDYNPAAVFIS